MIDGYDTAASIDTLVTVAGYFRLTAGDTASALANVLAATSRWREVAATYDLPEVEISEMAGAFEHPQTEAAQAVAAS